MALITCRSAAFGYDGGIVVSGLDFVVNSGDYLCVVGENGSGKSTLIKGLLRLKMPVEGEIATGDGLKPTEIGYLPQQTAAQKDFPAAVMEVVLSGRQNRRGWSPFYTREDKLAAARNLERLGIAELRDRCYRELSGGQQQRVLLARALCATGRMILLDEPVAGLDPVAAQELYRVVADINRNDGITVVMVSHDIHGTARYASHMLHLGSSQLFFGTADAYRHSPVGICFLGGSDDAASSF